MQHNGRSIHASRRAEARANEGKAVMYCPLCSQWMRYSRWEAHCKLHLDVLDLDCGKFRSSDIVFRPAFCPFCLGERALLYRTRVCQWHDFETLFTHIVEIHLDTGRVQVTHCPQPSCVEVSTQGFDEFHSHLQRRHGLSFTHVQMSKTVHKKWAFTPGPVTPSTAKRPRQCQGLDVRPTSQPARSADHTSFSAHQVDPREGYRVYSQPNSSTYSVSSSLPSLNDILPGNQAKTPAITVGESGSDVEQCGKGHVRNALSNNIKVKASKPNTEQHGTPPTGGSTTPSSDVWLEQQAR